MIARIVDRAYSLLEIKAVDASQRIIEGIASTPTPDRGGDVMEPLGASYTLPIPFLWFHNPEDPIGEVIAVDARPDGIHIKAQVSRVAAPGRLKTLVDEAWAAFTATPPLVRGLSVGWKGLEKVPRAGGGVTVKKWLWGELSAVTIPMNSEATILAVKTAAMGHHSPGDAGPRHTGHVMTTPEQITQFSNTRASKAARMADLMAKAAADNQTLDATATDEYDGLGAEVKSIDAHLVRLREQEALNLVAATRVVAPTPAAAVEVRASAPVIQIKAALPKGTAFTRMCMAIAGAKGDTFAATERARGWKDTPEVELMVKAAVAPGTTTDAIWAGPLAIAQPLVNEFLELLRPRTLLGRIPGMRQVPFNVSVPSQTGGGTYSWVGQAKPKPVTSAAFATTSVPFNKAAGIIVLTEELVKLSTPSAEALVREEMIAGMGQFLDTQFVDPAVAFLINVNPASITNGAGTAAASGATGAAAKADLAAQVAAFTAAGIPLEGSVWLMSDANAFGIALSANALAQPVFPGMTTTGGSIFGIPVVVSNNVGNRVILMHAPSILYADEGGVSIDASREASLQMDSAPADPADATTVFVSLWQRNLVGLRAERMITWIRARAAAVRYISAAAYNGS